MRYCSHCGNEVADEAVICLSCGCKTGYIRTAVKPTNVAVKDSEPGVATWSKICGILSFFIGWIILGVIAIILAEVSKKYTGGKLCSSAKTGYICGIISAAIGVIFAYILYVILSSIDQLAISLVGQFFSRLEQTVGQFL